VRDKEYLGDGLYVETDDFMIKLSTERENGTHYVFLEPEVIDALLRYLRKQKIIAMSGGGK
jgi:hypothetical protein